MNAIIAFDSHKRYTLASVETKNGKLIRQQRINHKPGSINKTNKLDALGLNKLQRAGTLPCAWIPPMQLRDARELPRTRMVFANQRTRLKNRIHSVLDKYGLSREFEDMSKKGTFGRDWISKW
jgi:transposase